MEFENLKLKCECGGKMEKIRTDWKGIDAENLKEGQKLEWKIESGKLILIP